MYYHTIVCLLVFYVSCIAQDDQFKGTKYYKYAHWGFFFAGFNTNYDTMFYDCYGYLINLIVLIIERHCLQHIIPETLKQHSNKPEEKGIRINETNEFTNDLNGTNLVMSDEFGYDSMNRAETVQSNAFLSKTTKFFRTGSYAKKNLDKNL